MKIIWMFIHTPNTENIECIRRLIDNEDAVVFIQNGVYASKLPFNIDCSVYYLKEDVIARGLEVKDDELIDYSGLIDLIFSFKKVVTF